MTPDRFNLYRAVVIEIKIAKILDKDTFLITIIRDLNKPREA